MFVLLLLSLSKGILVIQSAGTTVCEKQTSVFVWELLSGLSSQGTEICPVTTKLHDLNTEDSQLGKRIEKLKRDSLNECEQQIDLRKFI